MKIIIPTNDGLSIIQLLMTPLEKYFDSFRSNIVGADAEITTPYGTKKLIYADWIARPMNLTTVHFQSGMNIFPIGSN